MTLGATLALATVVVASMGAVLAMVLGRLADDPAARWVGLTIALFALIRVPASVDWALVGMARAHWPVALAVIADLTGVALLIAALLPATPPRWACAVLAVGLVGMVLSCCWPTVAAAVEAVPGTGPALAGASLATVGALAWRWRHRPAQRWAVAGGVLIALAQLGWPQAGPPTLGCTVVRLLGAVVLTAALGVLARDRVRSLNRARRELGRELERARARLREAAEKGHELRNGLAGLAAAASLTAQVPKEAARLYPVLDAELGRLAALLAGPAGPDPCRRYDVAGVLRRQVAVHRAGGGRVELMMGTALYAYGSPDTLDQVVATLLTNCARHAPGAAVRVCATRAWGQVRIRVSDRGPGLPTAVLAAGDGTAPAAGPSGRTGMGLAICRRLLRAEHAELGLANGPGGGAMVDVTLPTTPPQPDADGLIRARSSVMPARVSGSENNISWAWYSSCNWRPRSFSPD